MENTSINGIVVNKCRDHAGHGLLAIRLPGTATQRTVSLSIRGKPKLCCWNEQAFERLLAGFCKH